MEITCQKCDKHFNSKYKTALCNDCYNAVFDFNPAMIRTCKLCGRTFTPKSSRRSICYDTHYHSCPICNVDVITKNLQSINTCCCPEHSRLVATSTLHERYPHGEYCQNPTSNSKRAKTNLSRYNVDNPFKSAEFQAIAKANFCNKYGANNVFSVPEIRNRIENTMLSKYGVKHAMQNPEIRQKCLDTAQKRSDKPIKSSLELPEVKQKCNITNLEKYGTTIPMQTYDVWVKQSCKKSKYTASDGTKLDSTYEVAVYEFCIRNKLKIERGIRLNYEYEGNQHITFIDFRIEGILFECKGSHMLDGYFDYRGVPISAKLEVYKQNNVIVITDKSGSKHFGKPNSTDSNGLKYQNKCSNPLIGVDIELFKDNLSFPHRDDRPSCFYDVRVDGQMSAHDAFYNEAIRWKMIMNRINYSGGFIDAVQILNALNITRTCKQPSWFSKELAKKVIVNYCTCDTIVDPFAGWGARCDAATELHKVYLGCDFNPALVEWHHANGRTNIQYCDANQFKYEDTCSVFICPPYSDPESGRCFEDYNFEGFDASAKSLTQCEWLKIVMMNVPNAAEYVMVCKIVDSGWQQFVVDTKLNKSHFGQNFEYIVKVSNSMRDFVLTNL